LFKRIFRLETTDWIYSDGKALWIEVICDDNEIRVKRPSDEEAEAILERLLKKGRG